MFSYLDELDLSCTIYDDNYKSKKLADNPDYTEDIQAIDRWFQRRIELYKRQAFNAVLQEQNERERRRRNKVRKALSLLMKETLGDNLPETMSDDYPHYVYSEAPMPKSINEGFNENWIDEDLKRRGLYHPCMELIKQWLKLTVTASQESQCDKMREEFIANEFLTVLLTEREDDEMDLEALCDKYEDELDEL